VHQHHGRAELAGEPQCFVAVARLADDLMAGELEGRPHGVTEHRVIVDDQDAGPAVQDGLDPFAGSCLAGPTHDAATGAPVHRPKPITSSGTERAGQSRPATVAAVSVCSSSASPWARLGNMAS